MKSFRAQYGGVCAKCKKAFGAGALVRYTKPVILEVPERYNYEKQRTEGGHKRTLKFAHEKCEEK